ncbi:MAG: HYR domain-containing protein, partial [Bacteroidetes bacterium]|nr:HYR domain-containing protein [Bacteroidota bacterium]
MNHLLILSFNTPVITCPVNREVCTLPGEITASLPDIDIVIADECQYTQEYFLSGATTGNGMGSASNVVQFNAGVTTIEYRVTDVGGNSASCTFTVEVVRYQEAVAGPFQEWCNAYETYLVGNIPDPGYTATWAAFNYPGFLPPNIYQVDNEAVVTDLIPGFSYIFSYTLTNDVNGNPCSSTDYMTVINYFPPVQADAGDDQDLCNVSSFSLNGAVSPAGSGEWIMVNGPNNPVFNPQDPQALVTNVIPGQYTFWWQISNGVCQPVYDEVIINNSPAVTVDAGPDVTICPNPPEYELSGASAGNYSTLTWTTLGDGWFAYPNGPVNPVYYFGTNDITLGTVQLTVTGTGIPPCPDASDMITLTIWDHLAPEWVTNQGDLDMVGDCYDLAGLALVQAMEPVALDNCDNPVVPEKTWGLFVPDPDCPQAGTYTNTWTATDLSGNTSTIFTQVIYIVDEDPPLVLVKHPTVYLDNSGIATITAADIDNGSYDMCGNVTLSVTPTTFDCTKIGNNIVSFTVTDECQNSRTRQVNFQIADNLAPQVTCPSNIVVCSLPGETHTPVSGIDPQITDNCNDDDNFGYSLSGVTSGNDNGSASGVVQFNVGITTVTYWAEDVSHNSSSCSFTVEVIQSQYVNAGPDATVCAKDGEYFLVNASAGDYTNLVWQTSGNGTFDYSSGSATYLNPIYHFGSNDLIMGQVNITLTGQGNPPCLDVSDMMTLTLTPSEAPAINCPPDQTLYLDAYCEAVIPDYTSLASITGDCVDPVDIVQTPPPGTTVSGVGTVTVSLSAIDALTLVSSDQTTKTFNPGTLSDNTTYYWKVVAKTSDGTTYPGSVWTFETGASTPANWQCGDPLIDTRDGQSYPTVLIGEQCWMSRNLNIGIMTTSLEVPWEPHSNCTDVSMIEKYCIENDAANCVDYGGLYDWDEMMGYQEKPGSKGICPSGWHLPVNTEWCTMSRTIDPAYTCNPGCSGTGGAGLKETGTIHWSSPNPGATNSSGFTALGGGSRAPYGYFYDFMDAGYFWTSSLNSGKPLFYAVHNFNSVICHSDLSPFHGMSVRCVKNTPPSYGSPYQPVNPSPANGSTNQSVNSILSWDCTNPGNDPLAYDVYLGTAGIESTCTFNVSLIDQIPPVGRCKDLTIQLDIYGQASIDYGWVDNGSTDNCGISQYQVIPNSFNNSNVGPNVVTLTVIDGSGNSSTCTSIVTIINNCPPTIECPENIRVCTDPDQITALVYNIAPQIPNTCLDFYFFWYMAGATFDNGNSGLFDHVFNVGITTVVYVVTDVNSGNSNSCIFTVEVVQYQEPDAGQDITGCEISSANLTGNTPDPGYTPLWQQQSGPTAGLSQNGVQALITGLIPGNTYVFGYTLSNDVCSHTDYVTINDLANTEAANAGLNFSVCNTGGFTLHANTPGSGTGEWTLMNGPSNPVFDPGDPNTSVTGVVQGVYSFTWTIHNHP